MSHWSPYAQIYDPIKVGSIDGTDNVAHDKALIRALFAKYKVSKKVKGDPKYTIFVTRLNPKTDEDALEKFFSKFGSIKRIRLVRDIVTGISKRYAFIEYKKSKYADQAYHKAHRQYIDERQILVDYECERTLKDWKPRRLGGGFGGRKESGQLRFGCRDRPWKKPFRSSK